MIMKMKRFRSKVQLNYNPNIKKDLETNVIPKQLERDPLSDIFIRPKIKHLLENNSIST